MRTEILSSLTQPPLKVIKDNEDDMEVIVECPYCHSHVKYGETLMISGFIGCPHCYFKEHGLLNTVMTLRNSNYEKYKKGDFYKKGYREWLDETDYEEFTYKGYHCEIKRIPVFGHLCGYVTVGKEHPIYGKDYDELLMNIECHGGLTFSETKEGQTKIGFDCAHCIDLTPYYYEHDMIISGMVYRNMEYVKKECMKIVEQLEEIRNGR